MIGIVSRRHFTRQVPDKYPTSTRQALHPLKDPSSPPQVGPFPPLSLDEQGAGQKNRRRAKIAQGWTRAFLSARLYFC